MRVNGVPAKSIVLIGPRCCGKTSIGRELALRLGTPFIDADEEFKYRHGTVSNYVGAYESSKKGSGWPKFREKETEILERLCSIGSIVVLSPGGGAVAHDQGDEFREKNRRLLREFGEVIYLLPFEDLELSALALAERLQKDQNSASSRPPLTGSNDQLTEMLTILQKRHPLYLSAAHRTFYTSDRTINANAWEIFKSLGGRY